ncbi:unnamed protein product, partial [Darwinula stevensoni]
KAGGSTRRLATALESAWLAIPVGTFQNLTDSLPARLAAVRAAKESLSGSREAETCSPQSEGGGKGGLAGVAVASVGAGGGVLVVLVLAFWLGKKIRERKRTWSEGTPIQELPGSLSLDRLGPDAEGDTAGENLAPTSKSEEDRPPLKPGESPSPSESGRDETDESIGLKVTLTTTSSRWHRDAITQHWEALLERMDAVKVEDHMISKKKLRLRDQERLNAATSPRRRRSALLRFVHDGDPDVFRAFAEGLVRANQAFLVGMLSSFTAAAS